MYKKIRRGLALVWSISLLAGLVGCGQSDKVVAETETGKTDKMQIGLCFDSFVIERWLRDRDVFVSTAKELGAEVNVQNANGDVEQQISQIEYLIQKQVDALVIIAVDCSAISEVVQTAKEEGIKVVSYDRLINNVDSDLYISFDNKQVGKMMAQALVDANPQGGNIMMINGSPVDNNVKALEEGVHEVLDGSNLKISYNNYCDNWLAESAFHYVYEGLDKEPDICGVMCGNDDLASQAFRALAENQLAGKVALVGQDADLSACQHIVEGTQTMTVYKPVEELARTAAEKTVALIRGEGESDQKTQDTINDGTYDVSYIALQPIAVTKENMNVITDSGFHSAEEVYLNVDNPEAQQEESAQ